MAENVESGAEDQLSARAEGFVNKLQEIEGLIINARTQTDRDVVSDLFNKLNDGLDGKLLDEIEGHEDIWDRFNQAKGEVESMRVAKSRGGAAEEAEA